MPLGAAAPAYLVLAKDIRLAGAVAAGLRARLAEVPVLVPPMSGDDFAVPWAAQRLLAWWDAQGTGVPLAAATVLVIDAEELAWVGRAAYVAVRPGQVGARSYAPGSAVIEIPAATVGDLVRAVLPGAPGAAVFTMPRSRWRARRVWDRVLVRTAVLTGILGIGGWLVSAAFAPGAAEASAHEHVSTDDRPAVHKTIRERVDERLREAGVRVHIPKTAREAMAAAGRIASTHTESGDGPSSWSASQTSWSGDDSDEHSDDDSDDDSGDASDHDSDESSDDSDQASDDDSGDVSDHDSDESSDDDSADVSDHDSDDDSDDASDDDSGQADAPRDTTIAHPGRHRTSDDGEHRRSRAQEAHDGDEHAPHAGRHARESVRDKAKSHRTAPDRADTPKTARDSDRDAEPARDAAKPVRDGTREARQPGRDASGRVDAEKSDRDGTPEAREARADGRGPSSDEDRAVARDSGGPSGPSSVSEAEASADDGGDADASAHRGDVPEAVRDRQRSYRDESRRPDGRVRSGDGGDRGREPGRTPSASDLDRAADTPRRPMDRLTAPAPGSPPAPGVRNGPRAGKRTPRTDHAPGRQPFGGTGPGELSHDTRPHGHLPIGPRPHGHGPGGDLPVGPLPHGEPHGHSPYEPPTGHLPNGHVPIGPPDGHPPEHAHRLPAPHKRAEPGGMLRRLVEQRRERAHEQQRVHEQQVAHPAQPAQPVAAPRMLPHSAPDGGLPMGHAPRSSDGGADRTDADRTDSRDDVDSAADPGTPSSGGAGSSNTPMLPGIPQAPMPPSPIPTAGKSEFVAIAVPPAGAAPPRQYDDPPEDSAAIRDAKPVASPSGPPLLVPLKSPE